MTIYKYKIELGCDVAMPQGARILAIQSQHGIPVLWALVDESKQVEHRRFACYPTGGELPLNPGKYVGTFQMLAGNLVYHCFEVTEFANSDKER